MADYVGLDGAKLAGSDVYNTTFDVPINYGMIAGDFSAATVQALIDNVRYKGPCCGSTCFTSDTHILNSWYCFIWIPHRMGGQYGGDNMLYGVLLLFPMTFTNDYGYAVQYCNQTTTYQRFSLSTF